MRLIRSALATYVVLNCAFFGLCGRGPVMPGADGVEKAAPLVAVWCDYEAVGMNDEPLKDSASLQVAIWGDGRVLSTVSPTNAHSNAWSHQLREGWVSRETILALEAQLARTDVFDQRHPIYEPCSDSSEYSTLVNFGGRRKLLSWCAWQGFDADSRYEKKRNPHITAADLAFTKHLATTCSLPKWGKAIIAQRLAITRLALAVVPPDSHPVKSHIADSGQFWVADLVEPLQST